jgi:hypothetical protein
MLTNWTRLTSQAESQELLRILEDAGYRSYDNAYDSSHNGVFGGRFKVISIWDDKSYVGHFNEKDEEEHLTPETEMKFVAFREMLLYVAGE